MICCLIKDHKDTIIPTMLVDPITIVYDGRVENVKVPLATFEKPLWRSVRRGAIISNICKGIKTYVTQDKMTRSVVFKCDSLNASIELKKWIESNVSIVKDIVGSSSNYALFEGIFCKIVGNLLYVNLSINPGEASGHNMVTKVAQDFINWVLQNNDCRSISVSGNFCVDKKVSAVNPILGRGKNVCADIVVPKNICHKILKTFPEAIYELNTIKNLTGSTLAGSICSANAHYANMLLAVYLATGQDAANIVEGSQGITQVDVTDAGDLYFSVNLPNIIVGSVGNGKNSGVANDNLKMMGCLGKDGAKRLGAIIGATVLCGELSLMAALTNNGELINSHLSIERN